MLNVIFYEQRILVACFGVLVTTITMICIIIMKRRKIQQLNQSNLELKVLAEREKEVNATKTRFLSQMIHDLRMPTREILSIVERVQNEKELTGVSHELGEIECCGECLLNLMNASLDVNQIEPEKMKLHLKPITIQKLNQNVLHLAKQLIVKKGLNLQVGFSSIEGVNDVVVLADMSRVEQIFVNILMNMLYDSSDESSIEMTVELLESTKDRLTERYIIKDESTVGFGSFIVKQLVEMMNGTIETSSETHRGTMLSLVLSYEKA